MKFAKLEGVGGTLKSKMSFKNLIFEEISTRPLLQKKLKTFHQKLLKLAPCRWNVCFHLQVWGGDKPLSLYPWYSTYPVKWCIILADFNIFWSQSFILLGHHFCVLRGYFLVALHFTETSFYWHDFVLQIWVHHFTTQLLKIPAVSIILQVHFCYTETNRNQQQFSYKTRWRRTESALFVGKQYCLHYFTEFEPELRYSVHTLGFWVAEITPTHTMSTCIQSTLPHKVPFSPPVVKFPSFY